MRLIHTSDWHLGQMLFGHERGAEHRVFLDWLLDQLEQRQVDALLIAGDVFDQANPSAEAQALYYQFLGQALQRCPGLSIVVIAGNHDSPGRIEAPHPVLHALGVHVVGHYRQDAARGVGRGQDSGARTRVALRRRDGKIGAWVLAVPFLRPADLPQRSAEAYREGVAETYREIVDAALALREPDEALIAMGHLHLQGGKVSELSERKLVIGGQEALDVGIFPPQLSYVALGHLHLAQTVGSAHIRYSGSPLPLSFAELDYPHQIVEILLDGCQLLQTQAIAVPRPAPLLRVPAQHAPLSEVLTALRALQVDPAPAGLMPLIEVRVAMDHADTSLRAQIEQALLGKPLRFARIDPLWPAHEGEAMTAEDSRPTLDGLQPDLLFARLVRERTGAETSAQLQAAFAELLAQAEASD